MTKAEELADAICRIDTLTKYQRELIAQAAAELRRLDALEQAAEPVAWRWGVPKLKGYEWRYTRTKTKSDAIPLYTHPARKPMTRDDMRKLLAEHFDNGDLTGDDFRLIRAVERFHDIKE
jgi:hypothetical protein